MLMKDERELLNDLSSLLALLRQFDAVSLVGEYYRRYSNPAPESLLREQIEKMQSYLEV